MQVGVGEVDQRAHLAVANMPAVTQQQLPFGVHLPASRVWSA